MMSNLVETADLSELKKDYIGRMIKGMDAVGRMLFLFYWHNEKFVDKYGKADAPELEDTIRNVFDGMGDLVLFLHEKDVKPLGGINMSEPNLEEASTV